MGGGAAVDRPSSQDTARPAGAPARPDRLIGVDVARGLAILGMFVVHVGFGWQLADGTNALYGPVAGRAAALFAVLAGVAMALLSGGSRPRQGEQMGVALWRIVVRGLLILPIGVGLTMLDTGVSVILAYYSVFFVLAAGLLRERWRLVAALAAAWALAGPVASFVLRRWLEAPEGVGSRVAGAVNGADPLNLVSGQGLLDFLVTGVYPAMTWMPFVFAGLAVGRLNLHSVRVRWALVGVGSGCAALAYGVSAAALRMPGVAEALAASRDPLAEEPFGEAGVAEALYLGFNGTVPVSDWRWLLVAAPHSGTPFEVIGAGGLALAVLGVCLLAAPYVRWAVYPLACVGALALTVYVGHVLMIWVEESGLLAGTPLAVLTDNIDWTVVLGALVFAVAWRSLLGRGPLEWLVHVVSQWAAVRIP